MEFRTPAIFDTFKDSQGKIGNNWIGPILPTGVLMESPDVPFPRPLYPKGHPKGPSSNNVDVIGVKRAVSRAGYFPWNAFDEAYNAEIAKAVKAFQQANGLTATGNYGEPTHEKLSMTPREGVPGEWAFDTQAIRYMEQADLEINESPENVKMSKVRQFLMFCKMFDGDYDFGGEHDGSFIDDDIHDDFDCSSSCSFALWKFNWLGSNRAQVSGWFEGWGVGGRGKYITIHAAEDHVWIEINIDGRYYRFDTSPHGDGQHGPRVRTRPRSDSRFTHRHLAGF